MFSNRVMNLALTTAMYTDGWDYDSCRDWERMDKVCSKFQKMLREVSPKARVAHGSYRTAVLLKDWVLKVSHCGDVDALRSEAEFIAEMRSTPKFRKHFPKTYVLPFGDDHAVLIQERVKMSPDSKLTSRFGHVVEDFAWQFGITDMHVDNFGWAGPRGKEYPVFIDVDFREGYGADNPVSWETYKRERRNRSM